MNRELPKVTWLSDISLEEISEYISLINQAIKEETEITTLESAWRLLRESCKGYYGWFSPREDKTVPAEIQKELKEVTHHILLASPEEKKLSTDALKEICNLAPEASEFLIMYPEKFYFNSNDAAFITKHLPKDALKEPKVSVSGNCLTGQNALDIVPLAQKFEDGRIEITFGNEKGSPEKMMKVAENAWEPYKVYGQFVQYVQEEFQKPGRKAYQPIF